jgi:uncharacterized protein (TIGR03382 family)
VHDPPNSAGTIIALTTSTFVVSTGEIVDADIELHEWNGGTASAGYYFTCVDAPACGRGVRGNPNCVSMDLANTVTHEVGHFLGLDHVCSYQNTSCDPNATMAPNALEGETSKRSLGADDVEGVCSIYPAGQATSSTAGCLGDTTPPQTPQSGGGGGCSTAGTGGAVLAAAALLLLRRRRR